MLVPRILVPVDAKVPMIEATTPDSGPQAVPRSTLIPRILVPADAKAPAIESRGKTPQNRPALEATAAAPVPNAMLISRILVPVDAGAATAVPRSPLAASRMPLFVEAMLEDSPTRPRDRGKNLLLSASVHGILVAALLLVPLYFTEPIDLHEFDPTLLAEPPLPAPPLPPAPAPPAAARAPASPKKVVRVASKLVAPRLIPNQIARLGKEAGVTGLAAESPPGVPGGVPGGQPGGVISGILGGASGGRILPPPTNPAPKEPLRVGGEVKVPRLIYQIQPIYPPQLRKAKVSGDVVIEAVIDTQGNVVEMHPISGNQQLIDAAMDALRQWKYEPTILGGEAFPVRLLVTIEFRLT